MAFGELIVRRWTLRGMCVERLRRTKSERSHLLRHGLTVFAGAAFLLQAGNGPSPADEVVDLMQQVPLGGSMIAMGAAMDDVATIVYGVLLIKQAKQRLNTIKFNGGNDPLYGTVNALGANPSNTVSVLALGTSSQPTVAGWGDTDAGTFHSIQWTLAGGTQDIGTLLGTAGNSIGFGVSDDGSTIVG